jgi:hypothetical protein
MNQTPGRFPADRNEFVQLLEATEYADALRDESELEQMLIDVMKGSQDPITREIGESLANGTMTWGTLATSSAYSGFLDRGLAALQEFDFNGLAEDLTAAKTEPADPNARNDKGRREDDGADLWQGLRGRRRR